MVPAVTQQLSVLKVNYSSLKPSLKAFHPRKTTQKTIYSRNSSRSKPLSPRNCSQGTQEASSRSRRIPVASKSSNKKSRHQTSLGITQQHREPISHLEIHLSHCKETTVGIVIRLRLFTITEPTLNTL